MDCTRSERRALSDFTEERMPLTFCHKVDPPLGSRFRCIIPPKGVIRYRFGSPAASGPPLLKGPTLNIVRATNGNGPQPLLYFYLKWCAIGLERWRNGWFCFREGFTKTYNACYCEEFAACDLYICNISPIVALKNHA